MDMNDAPHLVAAKRKERFNLYQDAIVKLVCQAIDKDVEANSTFLKIDGLISTWPTRMEPVPTPDQTIVIEELFVAFDYGAAIVPYGPPFIPAGLQNVDGTGPEYRNYVIQIAW